MAERKPNLLFIMTDHQRADSLGMVQAGVEVAPSVSRLAAEGCTFARAYNTAPLCAPARTSLFTGKCPHRTGLTYNDFSGAAAQDHAPLQQYLAEAGWDVAHVGTDHVKVRPTYRERIDFAFWSSNGQHRAYLADRELADTPDQAGGFARQVVEDHDRVPVRRGFSSTRTAVWPHAEEHFLDSYWCRRACEFLAQPHERPFALFLFLWAPHPPLRVPEPYASMFDPAQLDLPSNVGRVAKGEPASRRTGVAGQLAEGISMAQWRSVWAAHLGLVRLADDGIGTVLDALRESGHDDDTIVTFSVDHGDFLGQHRMYQKFEMYEPAVRVPLIIRAPGATAARIDAPVSHLDVMPTLHELMGLPVPADMDGVSLAATVTGGEAAPDRAVFIEFCGCGARNVDRRAVITRRYKYVYDPGDVPELYDLECDPLEMTNLAGDPAHADVVAELHAQGKAWAESHGDWVAF